MSHALGHGDASDIYGAQVTVGNGWRPVFDGIFRGALACGLLGIGAGSFAAQFVHLPFNSVFQWSSAALGVVVGTCVGIRWGLRHRI